MNETSNNGEVLKKFYNAVIKGNAMAVSVVILGICIVISSLVVERAVTKHGYSTELSGNSIGNGLGAVANSTSSISNVMNNQNNNNLAIGTVNNKITFGFTDAFRYLGISEEELNKLVASPDSKIPYIKIEGKYTFSKSALDKWLETARVEVK